MNNSYNQFNELANEIDLLDKYLKDNQAEMSNYQLNQLKQRIALKRITLDKYYNRVDWQGICNENNDKLEQEVYKPIQVWRYILIVIIISILIAIVKVVGE